MDSCGGTEGAGGTKTGTSCGTGGTGAKKETVGSHNTRAQLAATHEKKEDGCETNWTQRRARGGQDKGSNGGLNARRLG